MIFLNKILEYAGEYKKVTFASVVVLFIGTAFNVLAFLFIYQLILPVITGVDKPAQYYFIRAALIFVCFVLHALIYTKGLALSHISAFHTLKNIRISLQRKLEKQPLGVIRGYGNGALKKIFIDDIDNLELLFAHAIPEGIANISVPAIIIIVMFFVDWKLALLSLCALPLGLFAVGMTSKAGAGKMDKYYKSAQKMNDTIVEYVNGMEVVKVFNRDGDSLRRFEDDINSYRDFTLDWYKECWPWMAIYSSLLPCVCLFTLPVGAYLVHIGAVTMPDLCLVLCMSFGIGAPILAGITFIPSVFQISYKIKTLEDLMASEPLKQSDRKFEGKNLDIDIKDVHFAYDKKEVIHGVSIHIPEGSMTALVGESGSGKSTLAKLLVHFYDVNEGSISLGGQNIQDMSLEALNDKISYVAQEQFLFNTTLMENIRMGKPSATDEEVLQAAEKAQCGEFLKRLEKGIYTMAGDGGKQLSGGERQRISLARAIIKDAPIVVLDEATAFMDPENEEKMNAAVAEVIQGKTVIVIAHRLHSIVNADKICVMDDGNLSAVGTHEELLKNSEIYKNLWNASTESREWTIKDSEVRADV